MAERASLECGHTARDSATELESAYENVSFPAAQVANSAVAGVGRGKLGKKPKPCPKPNYVVVKVAELNLQQQRTNMKGSNSSPLSSRKSEQRGSVGPTPPRPPAVDRSSKSTNTVSDSGVQVGCSSDQHLYDTAVRVQLDVLKGVPADVAFADAQERASHVPDAATASSVSKTMPIYATPRKAAIHDEPIYDEAEAVRSVEDEDPLYDDAAVVDSDRARMTFEGPEPLYADPEFDFIDNRAHLRKASTTQNPDDESPLYEEAQPVDRMAISCGDVYENNQVLSTAS